MNTSLRTLSCLIAALFVAGAANAAISTSTSAPAGGIAATSFATRTVAEGALTGLNTSTQVVDTVGRGATGYGYTLFDFGSTGYNYFGGYWDLTFNSAGGHTNNDSGSLLVTFLTASNLAVGYGCINGANYVSCADYADTFDPATVTAATLSGVNNEKGNLYFSSSTAFNKVKISYGFTSGAHETYGLQNATVAVTPVPEPETYAMLLAGLGAVGFMSRRRRLK